MKIGVLVRELSRIREAHRARGSTGTMMTTYKRCVPVLSVPYMSAADTTGDALKNASLIGKLSDVSSSNYPLNMRAVFGYMKTMACPVQRSRRCFKSVHL